MSLSQIQTIDRNDIKRELCKRSLAYFAKEAWQHVEPGYDYTHGWHIDAICAHLEACSEGQIRNLVINMPPRHMKSLLVSVFWPVWTWIWRPDSRWLFAAYAESLSVRDSVKARRLIQSPWFQQMFGHAFYLTGDQNEKRRYDNNKTGYRIATSVGGSATGEGGDYIIADDPHNVNEAESDVIRQNALDWWDHTMSTRGNDPKTVVKVIVMQRVHQADLSGHVLSQGGYEHLCLPAEYEGSKYHTSIGWTDPRKSRGDLLWPDRFGRDEIEDLKKRMGSRQAAGQLQQRPSAETGDIIKRAWIKRYATRPPKFDELILTLDATFTKKATSDFVALHCWGRIGTQKYLVDRVHARLGITGTIQALVDMSIRWPEAAAKLIEAKANGHAIEELLQGKINGMILWEPEGDKIARLNAVAPTFESGNVWFPETAIAPWIEEVIEELVTFPNTVHDDDVDACSMALLRLNKANTVGTIRVLR